MAAHRCTDNLHLTKGKIKEKLKQDCEEFGLENFPREATHQILHYAQILFHMSNFVLFCPEI